MRYLLFILPLLLFACSKSKDLNIKYEVITTAPIAAPYPSIVTNIGMGTGDFHNNFTSGTTWTATQLEDTEYRPLTIVLNTGSLYFNEPANVTVSLYINGDLKDRKTATAVQQGNQYVANPGVATVTLQ